MKDLIKIIIILICYVFVSPACLEKKDPVPMLVLFDFESKSILDELNWKCHTLYSLSEAHASHGRQSLKLELFPSLYPGLLPVLKHRNWSGFKSFCFDVYNPAREPVKIVLRIDDKKKAPEYKDRYNHSFKLMPGDNKIEIPLESLKTSVSNRPLNLEYIYRFMVFMSHPDKKHVLFFDHFRLVSAGKASRKTII